MPRQTITREWVEDRLDTLHPTHVEAFVRLLTALRTLFDGDLDAMLVLAATSVTTRGVGWRETLFEGRPLDAQSNPTNTQSIAHITHIPRETVRRKLIWLQDKGWVRRDEQGNWLPTRQAALELEPGTHATVNYLRVVLNAALRSDQAGGLATPKSK
jgi:hypothetical protein